MKKIKTFFLLALTLTTGAITAQNSKIDIGIEGGPSLRFLRGSEIFKQYFQPTVGFSGGISFQYNVGEVISLRTNIAFERKGMISKDITAFDANGNPTGTLEQRVNFDYITIPLLVRASFGEKIQFFINAGPYFGYLISQKEVLSGPSNPTIILDKTKYYKPLDVGISAGLGCLIPIGDKFAFTLEARHNLGLTNVSDRPVYNNGTVKTNATTLLAGFAYRIGG